MYVQATHTDIFANDKKREPFVFLREPNACVCFDGFFSKISYEDSEELTTFCPKSVLSTASSFAGSISFCNSVIHSEHFFSTTPIKNSIVGRWFKKNRFGEGGGFLG